MKRNNTEELVREDLDESEARRLGANQRLAESLGQQAGDISSNHLELNELHGFATAHRQGHGEKTLPEHLLVCPICLDLFQAILAGDPRISRYTMLRYEHTPGAPRRRIFFAWMVSRQGALSAAAALAVLLGAGLLYQARVYANPPVSVQGVFTQANGQAVAAGQALASRQPFTMGSGAALELNDGGTSVRAEAESEMSFKRSLQGDPRFVMHGGDIWVHAAKQKPGSSILVQTPLGVIRVIGTEFRVTVESEPVLVHENREGQTEVKKYAANISAVVVDVKEGTVALRNSFEQVLVTAGHTAVMRQNQHWIEVRVNGSEMPGKADAENAKLEN
ncbi:MAG: FecR domain-containing protein [bacterium]